MFRTVPLSIIRSFSLYTQQWYMSYSFADSCEQDQDDSTCFGQFLCPPSGDFHCTHSNDICHTGLLTSASRIRTTLHVSDSSSVHHQEFFTVHTVMVYVIQVCWQPRAGSGRNALILLSSCMTYTTVVCTMENSWWWTEEVSETCRVPFEK